MRLILTSSLEKVFLDEAPVGTLPEEGLSCFKNETVSLQAAWRDPDGAFRAPVQLQADSPLGDHIRVRQVRHVPVRFAAFPDSDDDYLRTSPGLYPDILSDAPPVWNAWAELWESAWIDVELDGTVSAGRYPLTVRLLSPDGAVVAEAATSIRVIGASLPEQDVVVTRWLHCDCIANAYGVEMFSDAFFRVAERFIAAAVRRGVNAILTPIHTPPLDTAVGGERMTCQLVDITEEDGGYSFSFDLLDRWIDMCLGLGVRYFEMAHLFTQWGAEHAPKIMVRRKGRLMRRFGWETDASGADYRAFLREYLTALTEHLRARGLEDRTIFHISDEPSIDHIESYRRAKEAVGALLDGFKVVDALSDIGFYEKGLVEHPVPASNHIEPFLRANVPGLWVYYCVGQHRDVSNQFIAMPGARTRILGTQMYLYDIAGFLHWGFNFYNTQYSLASVNPYLVTDGDGFAPAGDAFVVYPGEDGAPEESMRLMQFAEGLNDLRALKALEALRGRAFVEALVKEDGARITFSDYPRSAGWLLSMRERVNRAIEEAIR